MAEWASNAFTQQRFAHVVVALARWFHGALLIPEANFASAFLKTVWEVLQYQQIWRRKVEVVGFKELQKNVGFWMKDDDLKLRIFETLQAAMAQGAFVPRSKLLLEEMPQYEWKGGRIVHSGSAKTQDESAKGRAHGDRVIAAALAWHVCDQEPMLTHEDDEQPIVVPPGSMAARLAEHDAARQAVGDPWDSAGLDVFYGERILRGDDWS